MASSARAPSPHLRSVVVTIGVAGVDSAPNYHDSNHGSRDVSVRAAKRRLGSSSATDVGHLDTTDDAG